MTTRKPPRRIAVRAVSALLVLLLGAYFIFQLVHASNAPYKTVLATRTTVSDDITVSAIAVRDEQVLSAEAGGYYGYRVEDGERVSAGSVIANIYTTAEAARRAVLLEQAISERSFLIQLQNTAAGSAGADTARAALDRALADYSAAAARGETDGGALLSARTALAAYYRQTRKDGGYGDRIAALNEGIAALERETSPAGKLAAPQSGYFSARSDGMESRLNSTTVMQMTVAEARSLLAETPQSSDTPKLVSNYIWYVAAVVSAEDAQRFSTGSVLSLTFSYSGLREVSGTVVRVVPDEETGEALVVFEIDRFGAGCTSIRIEDVTISFSAYEGIVVPRSALRIEEGEVGVYVKFGNVVRFVTVDKLFENDEFLICRADNKDASGLRLYDEIITEGKDLYVGKELS